MTNFVHLHIANFYMALHYNILAYNLQHFAGLIASSTSAQIVTGSHKYYAQVRWRAIQIPLFTKRRTRDDATAPIPIPYSRRHWRSSRRSQCRRAVYMDSCYVAN